MEKRSAMNGLLGAGIHRLALLEFSIYMDAETRNKTRRNPFQAWVNDRP